MDYQSKKFLWRQRIGFGISDYACNLAYLMVNTYLLIFYTDVARIPAAAAGVILLVTKITDGFIYVIVGTLMDRTNTKMGRNRPWMLAGTPLIAISMVLVFITPNWSATGKLIWAYFSYMLFSFSYTVVNLPLGSILPTLSKDPVERTNIATTRTIFSGLGSLTSASLALWLIAILGHGNDAVGYRNTNIIFALLAAVILIISVSTIREINPAPKPKTKLNIWVNLKQLFKNRPYVVQLCYTFTMFLCTLSIYAAIAYYFTYIIGNKMMTSVAVSIITVLSIIGMVISANMNHRYGKRNLSIAGNALQVVGFLVVLFSQQIVPVIYVGIAIVGFGIGFKQNIFFSMSADVVDYGEWKFGQNLAATQTAVRSFANTFSSALSSAIIGWLLAWGGYAAGVANQAPKAQLAIMLAFIGLPMLGSILSIFVLLFYNLDGIYPQVRAELDARKAKAAQSAQNIDQNETSLAKNVSAIVSGEEGVDFNEKTIHD